jgi:hypothetical protein
MDLGVHVPSALGVLAAAFLIWKYPLSVPRERLPTVIATFVGAYALFVFYLFVRRRALLARHFSDARPQVCSIESRVSCVAARFDGR